MEIHQLRHMLAAAEHSSYAQAAKRCFTSRQNIAHSVKALENELGIVLFERRGNEMVLTPAGRQLVGEAGEIVRCCSMAAIIAPSYFQSPCSGGFFIFRAWKPPVPMAPISNRCLPIPWANRGNAPDRVVFFSPYGPFMEKSAFVCRKSRNPRVETPPQWA